MLLSGQSGASAGTGLSNVTDHNGFTRRTFNFPSNRRCEHYGVLLFGGLFLVPAVETGHTSAGNELPRVEDPNHEDSLAERGLALICEKSGGLTRALMPLPFGSGLSVPTGQTPIQA